MSTKLQLTDSDQDVLWKMSEGNPGALKVCMGIIEHGAEIDPDAAFDGFHGILALDTLNFYGIRTYVAKTFQGCSLCCGLSNSELSPRGNSRGRWKPMATGLIFQTTARKSPNACRASNSHEHDPAQQAWLFEQERRFSKEQQPNKMVRAFGPAGGDKHCKDCRLLLRKVLRSGRVFFKCSLVGDTSGPGTDFRAGWDACTKFVPRQQRERKTAGNKIMYCA